MQAPVRDQVFISYSHKDGRWLDELLTHLKPYVLESQITVWSDEELDPGDKWFDEIQDALARTKVGVFLVTPDFLVSKFIRQHEFAPLLDEAKAARVQICWIPVRPSAYEQSPLNDYHAISDPEKPLAQMSKPQRDAAWVLICKKIAAAANSPVAAGRGRSAPVARAGPVEVAPARLPGTGRLLIGRRRQLGRLTRAWRHSQTHLLSIVAWGGVGKTALVKHWLGRMAADDWCGAERVFDWSFYSQGTSEQRAASADGFIDAALRWFGDDDPTKGSPWDKGARLAGLVAGARTLLVLDGLEPLQHPPGPMDGRLKDPAMQALLTGLARHNPGLCVLTTRQAVADLEHLAQNTCPVLELEELSPEDGGKLLWELGVKRGGPTELDRSAVELQTASAEFGGHALAVTLLGSYLAEVCGGDVARIGEVDLLDQAEAQGGHARRVLRSYERWLGDATPETAVLRLTGLFDRPAEAGCLAALRAEPAIEGLTEPLVGLSDRDWQRTLTHLRKLHLLADSPGLAEGEGSLDAHPLVREHFGDDLRTSRPAAWQAAHRRLYEHLKTAAPERPDTLAGLMPLYHAVGHGCLAGLHQEALYEILFLRIHQGNEHFSQHKLGAFGAELSALAHLFDHPWDQPARNLTPPAQATLLGNAGFVLRAQGRLAEAAQPMRAALELAIAQEDWENAATAAGNLGELHLALGDVAAAVEAAQQSVELADRSDDGSLRMVRRTTLADALHQSGRRSEAASLFQKAETMQKERQPEFPLLYSLRGFLYCDLLLGELEGQVWDVACGADAGRAVPEDAPERCREVQTRGKKMFEWRLPEDSLLDVALDQLTLGRTQGLEAILQTGKAEGEGPSEDSAVDAGGSASQLARQHLDEAVTGLRAAGQQHELPRGLLARAGFCVACRRWDEAEADLDEARAIAERGPMRLHLADVHLIATRLHLARHRHNPNPADLDEARRHLRDAAELIDQTGYHRRDEEVARLRSALEQEQQP